MFSQSNSIHGMSLAAIATFLFAVETVIVRHLTPEIHPFEIAFFAALGQSIALIPWMLHGRMEVFRTRKLHLHTLRVGLSTVAVLGLFYALRSTPLAKVTALNFTQPIFTAVLAIYFLKETVKLKKWGAILLGFSGAMVVLRPGYDVIDLGSLVVLSSAFFFAITTIVIKILTRTDSIITICIYGGILRIPLCAIPAAFVWKSPEPEHLAWFACIGVVELIAVFSLTQALKEVDTATIAPLFFLQLIWAAAFGYVFFSEIPGIFTWIGAAIIIVATTVLAINERVSKTN